MSYFFIHLKIFLNIWEKCKVASFFCVIMCYKAGQLGAGHCKRTNLQWMFFLNDMKTKIGDDAEFNFKRVRHTMLVHYFAFYFLEVQLNFQ